MNRLRAVWAGTITLCVIAVLAASSMGAEIPAKINYQGMLADASGEPLPGEHTVVFRIFDADAGGTELWSETQPVTADTSGVFSAILGSADSIDAGFDGPRWLEIEVDGEILTPRRELVSVPYAFQAASAHMVAGFHADAFADSAHSHHSLDAADGNPVGAVFVDDLGKVGIGTATPTAKLHVDEQSNGPSAIAIYGYASSPTAQGSNGVIGIASSADTTVPPVGVYGSATDVFGNGKGVYGKTYGASGTALYGYASNYSGQNFGLRVHTNSPAGYAGYFTGGRNYFEGRVGIGIPAPLWPLQVENWSTGQPVGIVGECQSDAASSPTGVWGLVGTSSTTQPGQGVYGKAFGASGSSFGVRGQADGLTGRGVYGHATSYLGTNYGVYGETASSSGYAGYFVGGRNYFERSVGIGTTIPTQMLHVAVPVAGMLWYTLKLENSGNANGTATGVLFKVEESVEPGADRGKGGLVYERTDTYGRGDFHILQDGNANADVAASADAVVTIKNNGNVGIGTKTPGYKLQVGAAGDGSEARANAWNLLSSREYKNAVRPLSPAQCQEMLEKATCTDVVAYTFAGDPAAVRHLGVIAEDSPAEIVASDGKGVSLGDYAAFLLAAIKAQQAEIEDLRAEVRELQSRVRSQ
jgi:hypothetical protein